MCKSKTLNPLRLVITRLDATHFNHILDVSVLFSDKHFMANSPPLLLNSHHGGGFLIDMVAVVIMVVCIVGYSGG